MLSSAEETSKLVFTDVGAKKVKSSLLGEDVLTVEVLSGTGTGGQTDGAKAAFHNQRHAAQKQALLLTRQLEH